MQQLKDKVIFLTGGSEIIGYEYAKAFASEGAKVLVVANNATSVNEVVA